MESRPWLQAARYLEQARLAGLVAVAVTVPLPFTIAWNGGLTIAMLAFSLGMLICRWKAGVPRERAAYLEPWLQAGLFALYALSLFWLHWPWLAASLDRRLPLIAFPAMVAFAPPSAKDRDRALFSFTVAMTVLFLAGEALALRQYLRIGQSHVFFAGGLTHAFDLHRVYTSVHALFALCALTLVGRDWAPPFWRRLWQLVLLAFVLLLASRNTTLTLLVLGALYAGWLLLRGRGRLAVGVVAGLVVGIAGALAVPQVREILASSKLVRQDWGTPGTVNPNDGWQVRHFVWKAAWQVGQAMPWYGNGGGAARYMMADVPYKEMGFTYGIQQVLNAHNQFLETWLDVGYPGLTLLVVLVGVLIVQGYRRSPLLLVLGLITLLTFMTESYLEAQKGVAFFGLFWTLLGSGPPAKDKHSSM